MLAKNPLHFPLGRQFNRAWHEEMRKQMFFGGMSPEWSMQDAAFEAQEEQFDLFAPLNAGITDEQGVQNRWLRINPN